MVVIKHVVVPYLADCPHIVSRKDWGAKAPTATTAIHHPIPKVFIHHTDTGACTTQAGCSSIVKGIQEYHQKTRGACRSIHVDQYMQVYGTVGLFHIIHW